MSARITLVGNVASAPAMRQTSNGRSVTNFRVGPTERHLDRESGTWVDGARFFVGVSCWGTLAENVAASMKIGSPVMVYGRIQQRSFSSDDQTTRTYYEINADSVGHDLNRGSAKFERTYRSSGPAIDTDADGHVTVGLPDGPFDTVDEHPQPSWGPVATSAGVDPLDLSDDSDSSDNDRDRELAAVGR